MQRKGNIFSDSFIKQNKRFKQKNNFSFNWDIGELMKRNIWLNKREK